VRPDTFAAVVINRTVEMVIAVMAILKAGGAYVPLEPYLPGERIRVCLASLNVKWLLTNRGQLRKMAGISGHLAELTHIFCLDARETGEPPDNLPGNKTLTGPGQIETNNGENLQPINQSTDIAYVIFTSGTTGNPKGVVEQHRPVINTIQWVNAAGNVNPADKLLFIASLSFDLSVYDIFGVLAAGGTIRVARDIEIKTPGHLLNIILREGITAWDSAPAALQQLVPAIQALGETSHNPGDSIFRLVLLSGDWIPVTLPDILREAFTGIRVMALGGATEATIWSNHYPVGDVDPQWSSIPYGKPIQNARYYILDSYLKPCPTGVPGDLYIGGQCLASGYINEVELTAAKFPVNPFIAGERMYRTGDRARFFPDGNIEFLGRIDNQVKIRGYRVELGEIESKLAAHPHIKATIVSARQLKEKEKYLCAYIVFKDIWEVEGSVNVAQLREHLSKLLPDYMIPAHFIEIDEIPLTPNGKVDRKALEKMGQHLETGVEYEAPSNEMETVIANIWKEALGLDKIGIHDNFFDLGGNSMSIVGVNDKLSTIIGRKIPVAKMFVYPTIQSLAEFLAHGQTGDDSAGETIEESVDALEDALELLNIGDDIGESDDEDE
jgi:amino acid adenylation domain-containing protein